MLPRLRKNRLQRRRGATVVEAALVLPFVLMFILGIVEYARYLMTLHVFTNATREGCRYAVAHLQPVTLGSTTYGNTTSDVTNKINSFLFGQTLSGQSTSVYASDAVGNNLGTWTNATAGQSICVSITGNYKSVVTSLLQLPSTIPISIKVVMDCESP